MISSRTRRSRRANGAVCVVTTHVWMCICRLTVRRIAVALPLAGAGLEALDYDAEGACFKPLTTAPPSHLTCSTTSTSTMALQAFTTCNQRARRRLLAPHQWLTKHDSLVTASPAFRATACAHVRSDFGQPRVHMSEAKMEPNRRSAGTAATALFKQHK